MRKIRFSTVRESHEEISPACWVCVDVPAMDDLEFSIRAYNCLQAAGIKTLEQLAALTDEDLRAMKNLGAKSIENIKQALAGYLEDQENGLRVLNEHAALANKSISEFKRIMGKSKGKLWDGR